MGAATDFSTRDPNVAPIARLHLNNQGMLKRRCLASQLTHHKLRSQSLQIR